MAVKKNIIVVGLGSIGYRHARLLRKRSELEVALCDSNMATLERAQQNLGISSIYTTFEAALDAQPNMMVIATPHNLHVPQAIQALEAGIHVLCEKPISDSLESAYQLEAIANRSDKTLAFGFHLHFHPSLQRIKQLIDEGHLGQILHAHCHVGSYITLENSVSRYQSHLFGALLLDYAHLPDTLNWLLNQQPSSVHAHALQDGDMELLANPNVILVTCEYAGNMLSTIHLNYVQTPERHEYEIIGDKGWIVLNASTGHIRHGDRATNKILEENIPSERDKWYIDEHQAFLDTVAGKRQPESPIQTAMVSMEIYDSAIQKLA